MDILMDTPIADTTIMDTALMATPIADTAIMGTALTDTPITDIAIMDTRVTDTPDITEATGDRASVLPRWRSALLP
jgi:hypothetical protein